MALTADHVSAAMPHILRFRDAPGDRLRDALAVATAATDLGVLLALSWIEPREGQPERIESRGDSTSFVVPARHWREEDRAAAATIVADETAQ